MKVLTDLIRNGKAPMEGCDLNILYNCACDCIILQEEQHAGGPMNYDVELYHSADVHHELDMFSKSKFSMQMYDVFMEITTGFEF